MTKLNDTEGIRMPDHEFTYENAHLLKYNTHI